MTISRPIIKSAGSLFVWALGFCGLWLYVPTVDDILHSPTGTALGLLCLVLFVAGLAGFLLSLDHLEIPALKVVVFVVLLSLYAAVGRFALHQDGPATLAELDVEGTVLWLRELTFYVVGAALAVWGDKTVGTLQPISLRPLFVILGVGLMAFGLVYPLIVWLFHVPSPVRAAVG